MQQPYRILKRTTDLVGAIVGLLLFAIPMLVISLLILWQMGRPILFTQERAGTHGEPFTIYKFRTMTNETDDAGNLLPAEERITPLGHTLRTTTMDELPEFLNVLRGDMSLVGPRPLHTRYVDRYNDHEARRLLVKPGMTGLAVIHGREEQDWDERFKYDVEYVQSRNLVLDVVIILKTIVIVLQRSGAEPADGTIKEEFSGSGSNTESD